MADPLGISFSPTGESQQNSQKPTPIQQAIQTLSLRIPRVVGAGGGAPQELLQGAGGAGLGGNPNAASVLEAIRRMLFGGGAPQPTASPMPPMPGAPGGGEITGVPNPRVGFPAPGRAPEAPPSAPTFPIPRLPRSEETLQPNPAPAPPQPPRLGPGVGPPRAPREPGDRRF